MNEPNVGSFSLRLSSGLSMNLTSGVTLKASELPGLHSVPPGGPVATVNPHPTEPGIYGLQNLSHLPWRVQLPNGDSVEIKPSKSVRLAQGTRIDFGPIQGDIELGHEFTRSKSRVPFWIGLAGAGLVLGSLTFGGWYFEQRLTAEKARRERIAREEQLAREETQKRDQERAAQLQKQQEEAAAAAQQAAQEQARAQALAAAAAKSPTPTPAPPPEFYGTWVADGPSYGVTRHGDDHLTEKKVQLGSWHATLVIRQGDHGSFVFECTEHFLPGMGHWFDMPAPFNDTPTRYMKYSTESLEISPTNSGVSVLWDGWKLVEWRPKRYPHRAFELQSPAELPVQKMLFKLTGPDQLTSADLVFHRVK